MLVETDEGGPTEVWQIMQTAPISWKPLINFERCLKFNERLQELAKFKPASLERYRGHGQLAYVETHLRGVRPSSEQEEDFAQRSSQLQEEEYREWRQRKQELKKLGFRMPVP